MRNGALQVPLGVPRTRPARGELLKPILDQLKDKLGSFEGEPTPADHRWLRGQLRKLVDRLDLKSTGRSRKLFAPISSSSEVPP